MNSVIEYSEIGMFFDTKNDELAEEIIANMTSEQLQELENNSLTHGITTPETRLELRRKYNNAFDKLWDMYEKIKEMQKNNTYGAIR